MPERVLPARPWRCRTGVPGQPGVTLMGCHLKAPGIEPPVAGSCGSPAPAAAPLPAALPMTSAGTASVAGCRHRRVGPTPAGGCAGAAPRMPGRPRAASPCAQALAPDRHARLQRDGQEQRSPGRARLRHGLPLHPPSPVCQAAGKIPCNAAEAGGRFRTARTPAATSPGAQHPKSGAHGAGGALQAPTNPPGRN